MQALILEQSADQHTLANVREISPQQLPENNVTVAVQWSGLNYKDALAITGRGKIIRQFPMIPGIDFAGTVLESADPRYQAGDAVILTGWGVGETYFGGLAEQARVNADWLLPLPAGLSQRQSMIIGTAGLTAMLCVMALEAGGVTPEQGEVLVTGAGGGVGSVAVSLLSQLGYRVAAVTGRAENHAYLQALGASRIIERAALSEPGRPLDKQHWAGAIDTVGGQMLANVLAQTTYGGTVAACGLAGGAGLPTTVMPFILRNVRLQGVDSVQAPYAVRQQAWSRLATLLPESFYQQAAQEITLAQAPEYAARLLDNQVTGRTLVRLTTDAPSV
ncbi:MULTISPECIES: MDR family oxidoreductase [Plesiomonas]|uniref:acrylyl-CoA reductase (NADPH) n=1 Tax=Plesiomonas TaxID=702 RepID=UPI0007ED211A|nr:MULTISPECIES: MDR family oxidoreductase [Plesiomonas]KAB7675883.1 acryloyl-CoA reductase [Plesiomonas shigelloides]KAB7691779.1 acryloyl-CoA reductase [Plesiomonas shigelloides]MCE5164754.1 oxidoreductase [Plesiomonas sp. PI-19]MCQ8859467.1 oxidoreductase [Plesiomonas shigelloides]SBT59909.1 Putative quinone oxidoreductase YhdH [Plesiomonas shigelloides]